MDKRHLALDELEMFDLLQAAYPEKFPDDSDECWESAMEFADNIHGYDELADLLGRVAMLTMPMKLGLTGRVSHCLGRVEVTPQGMQMTAAVRRDFIADTKAVQL